MSLCKRCNGSGSISVRHGLTFETDSAAERALARHQTDCPECGNPVKRRDQRIATLVSALEEVGPVLDEAYKLLRHLRALTTSHDKRMVAALATIEKAIKDNKI